MENLTNVNVDQLKELIFKLIRDGKEEIAFKELEEMYKTKVEITNKINEIRQKISLIQNYGYNKNNMPSHIPIYIIEIEIMLDKISQIKDKERALEQLSEISKELEEVYKTKVEITNKINEIRQKQIYLNTYGPNRDFVIKYEAKRLIEIEEILQKISQSNNKETALKTLSEISKELEEMYLPKTELSIIMSEIAEKISIVKQYRYNRTISEIYNSILPKKIEKELYETSQIKDKERALEQLSNISKKLDLELINLNNLYVIDNHRERNFYSRYFLYEYNVNGIIIKINIKTKEYEISYNDNIINLLTECKINKLKKLLSNKLRTTPSNKIIEPKYVNEKILSDYLKGKNVSLKENFKYNINGLLRYLSSDKEMKNEKTLEELSEHHEKIKAVYNLIRILDSQEYKTDKTKLQTFSEDIITKYQSINLEAIKDIYVITSSIILKEYPNETFLYSSLQAAYNCINRNTIKKIHQDLSKGNDIENSSDLKAVIEFIKKYTRNKEGKAYTNDEIINFLNQKNEIVNANYSFTQYDYEENNDTINSDVNNIMYKITGRRH